MKQDIFQIALIIDDYDKALSYYTSTLNFNIIEDTNIDSSKRWIRISPQGSNGFTLLLSKAKNEDQKKAIGNQSGGRVFLFMHTDNALRDYKNYTAQGVKIIRKPSIEPYGTVFVFQDIYGNLWDVIQSNK